MSDSGNLDYAQARLQARHGARITAADWARLDASRDLQHLLATATATSLSRWTHGLHPEMGPHALEQSLRSEWRAYVAEIASWLPARWQPAATWISVLADLEYVARLAVPQPTPPWMFADPVFGPLAPGSPAERATALMRTEYAPLASVIVESKGVREAWCDHWRRLMPTMDSETADQLEALASVLRTWSSSSAPLEANLDQLRIALARVFRRSSGSGVSAFAHLASTALDVLALRGRIVERAIFGAARRAA